MHTRYGPIAVLLLLASAAHAQTTVTLYGIADGDLRIDHTSIGTLKSVGSGGESSSRWGLRGTEDLGNGLRAVFNFEQDFDLSDNSAPQGNIGGVTPSSPSTSSGSRLFGRRAIVGIGSTQFGEIRFGREYTPLYQGWVAADPFAAGTVSRGTNFAVGSVTRVDNSVNYETPTVAGFTGKAQFSFGESTTDSLATTSKDSGDSASAAVTYAQGPLYAAVGYLTARVGPGGVLAVRSANAALTYDLQVVKLHALYFFSKKFVSQQQAASFAATVPLGAFKLIGSVARVQSRGSFFVNDGESNDANLFGLGGNYALSKRTDLYLVYSKIVNQGAAAFIIGDNSNNGLFTAANVPAGFNPWSAQFGIRHLF